MSETKIDGKTLDEWISIEIRKRKVSFWGADYEIEPVICSKIQGDGLQLVYVQSMDQRPNYWLLRIDSKANVEDDDFDIEILLEPLEEEFGSEPENYCYNEQEFINAKKHNKHPGHDYAQDYDSYEEYEKAFDFPCVWWQGGFYGSIVNFGS